MASLVVRVDGTRRQQDRARDHHGPERRQGHAEEPRHERHHKRQCDDDDETDQQTSERFEDAHPDLGEEAAFVFLLSLVGGCLHVALQCRQRLLRLGYGLVSGLCRVRGKLVVDLRRIGDSLSRRRFDLIERAGGNRVMALVDGIDDRCHRLLVFFRDRLDLVHRGLQALVGALAHRRSDTPKAQDNLRLCLR